MFRGARYAYLVPQGTTMREWLLVAFVVAVFLFLSFSGSPEPT
jgi:hypothetical protein